MSALFGYVFAIGMMSSLGRMHEQLEQTGRSTSTKQIGVVLVELWGHSNLGGEKGRDAVHCGRCHSCSGGGIGWVALYLGR